MDVEASLLGGGTAAYGPLPQVTTEGRKH
jgi:hypothetical protein